MEQWADINDELPWPQYKGESVTGGVLVTVQLRKADPNDDPEVMLLDFDCRDSTFRVPESGALYETWNTGRVVTAWRYKPEPFVAK